MRSIAHISDLHFGRLDKPVAEALVADLAMQPPSVLVVSGDFTQRARAWQYAEAAEYLRRLPSPQVVVPGNHDVPMYDVVRRFFRPLDRYVKYISGDLSPSYSDSELFVLGVNTARSFTQKSGWLKKHQLVEVNERFRHVPESVLKVLVAHHPFIPPPDDRGADIIRGAGRVLEALDPSAIDLVLGGHLHRAYQGDVRSLHRSAPRSVLSIQAGTTTSTRRRHEANSYNWITHDAGMVTVAIRMWNGRGFEVSKVSRYRRVDQIWEIAQE
jgi:3',5'-cyclic AMP phosphodiesterase CpdA